MTVKIKARDIIPGWPRGRSAGGLGTWAGDFGPDSFWMLFFGRSYWSHEDLDQYTQEIRLTDEYHARQNRMFFAYVERYRRLTEFGECLLDPGYFICLGQRTRIGSMKLRGF